MDQLLCAPLSPHPLLIVVQVDMRDTDTVSKGYGGYNRFIYKCFKITCKLFNFLEALYSTSYLVHSTSSSVSK